MSLFTHLRVKIPAVLKGNPLPEVLEAIPTTITMVNLELAGKIAAIIAKRTNMVVNNHCVLFLLKYLADKDLIYFHTVATDNLGDVILIRKK